MAERRGRAQSMVTDGVSSWKKKLHPLLHPSFLPCLPPSLPPLGSLILGPTAIHARSGGWRGGRRGTRNLPDLERLHYTMAGYSLLNRTLTNHTLLYRNLLNHTLPNLTLINPI